MRQTPTHLLLAGLLSLATASAMSETIVVNSSLKPGYRNAGTYTGQFDMRPFLPEAVFKQRGEGYGFVIDSAQLRFEFADDSEDLLDTTLNTSVSLSSYRPDATRLNLLTRTQTEEVTITAVRERESAGLRLFGTEVAGASSNGFGPAPSRELVILNTTIYEVPCTVGDCRPYTYQTVTERVTVRSSTDFTGPFGFSFNLTDPRALASLVDTGLLDFGLSVKGDLMLRGSALTLELVQFAPSGGGLPPTIDLPAPLPVPEPSSAVLALLGLMGLGLLGRARMPPA